MSTIVTRAGKGSPLSNTEVDANFTNLNNDKYELPSQTGNSGKFLTTNGSVTSWGTVDLTPYLTTATAASTYVALAGSYANPTWVTSLAGSKISGNITGNAANVTGTVAIANGGTGNTTGYKLFAAEFTSSINANTNRTTGVYGSYASAATNTPTTSGILYNFTTATDGSGDGGQFWQDYVSNNLYLRQRWGGSYGSWLTILSASNYNSYSPTLTGTGASGTWGISISGNAATATTATTATTANALNAANSYSVTGLTVGSSTASSINMVDTDEGTRVIHCNSNRIGFLNQSGGWGSYCDDAGNWSTDGAFYGAGTGLTGTAASLSIGGNAATATSATSATSATYLNSSNYIVRTGSSGNLNTDFNNTPAGSTRIGGDDASLTNSPGNTWWFYQHMRHSNNSNYWGTQIAWGWEDNPNRLMQRNVSAGTWSAWVEYLNTSGRTFSGNLTMSGNITANSDIRLKDNVVTIPDALAKVESVRGVNYTWKESGLPGIGVIAQEIQAVAPEAVLTADDGTLSVAYGNLVGLLIEAVKELSGQVKELKAKVGN